MGGINYIRAWGPTHRACVTYSAVSRRLYTDHDGWPASDTTMVSLSELSFSQSEEFPSLAGTSSAPLANEIHHQLDSVYRTYSSQYYSGSIATLHERIGSDNTAETSHVPLHGGVDLSALCYGYLSDTLTAFSE